MVPKLTAPLRKALQQLESEKERIDHQIIAVRSAIVALGGTRPKGKQPRMSAAARRAIGKRMKAYWARRKAAAKGRMKGVRTAG